MTQTSEKQESQYQLPVTEKTLARMEAAFLAWQQGDDQALALLWEQAYKSIFLVKAKQILYGSRIKHLSEEGCLVNQAYIKVSRIRARQMFKTVEQLCYHVGEEMKRLHCSEISRENTIRRGGSMKECPLDEQHI